MLMDTRNKEFRSTLPPNHSPLDAPPTIGLENWETLFTDSSRDSRSSRASLDPIAHGPISPGRISPSPIDPSHALEVAMRAARDAGAILRKMLPIAVVREKSPKDLVTDADVAAQNAIIKVISECYPEHQFLGEEDAHDANSGKVMSNSRWQWVVDPLDGTTNFAHGLRSFAVSIALMHPFGNPSANGLHGSR
ncbi:MAG: inositol monophosphatase family protein, partial [Pirellula sp.]